MPRETVSAAKAFWGPPTWMTLHTVAAMAESTPFTSEKAKIFRDFVFALRYLLPCDLCRKHLTANLGKIPPPSEAADPSLASGPLAASLGSVASPLIWSFSLHNEVNRSLGKPIIPISDLLPIYLSKGKVRPELVNRLWSSEIWRALHSVAAAYSPDRADAFADFIIGLTHFIPCITCVGPIPKFFEQVPFRIYLSNKEDLFFWTYVFHDLVTRRDGKSTVPSFAAMKKEYAILEGECRSCSTGLK